MPRRLLVAGAVAVFGTAVLLAVLRDLDRARDPTLRLCRLIGYCEGAAPNGGTDILAVPRGRSADATGPGFGTYVILGEGTRDAPLATRLRRVLDLEGIQLAPHRPSAARLVEIAAPVASPPLPAPDGRRQHLPALL